jgi:hypothetical protein
MQKDDGRGFDWPGLPVFATVAQPLSSIGDAPPGSASKPKG